MRIRLEHDIIAEARQDVARQLDDHALRRAAETQKIGPLAYYDKEKYPTGPWCKEKDWVIFARYAGSRLPVEGGEVRLLNDDESLRDN